MPITLHLATGRRKTSIQAAVDGDFEGLGGVYLATRTEILDVLADEFIWGGIFDRYPELQIVCSEFEISWIPFFIAKMDEMQFAMGHRFELPKLERPARDYVLERCWHVLINDRYAAETINIVGPERVLWGSDFPHVRSIGLDTQPKLAELFGNFSAEERDQMIATTVSNVYQL